VPVIFKFKRMTKKLTARIIIILSTLLLKRNAIESTNVLIDSFPSDILWGSRLGTTNQAKLSDVKALKDSNANRNIVRYPYVAYMYFEEEDEVWRCGGTLIAEDVILTAAHCLPKRDSFYGSVTLGGYESYDNEPQENYRITEIKRHPGYQWNGYIDNDFAVAKIDRCSGVQPVILKNRIGGRKLVDGEALTALGWEDTFNEEGFEEYTTIQESTVRLNYECEPWRSRRSLGTMTDSMLCAISDALPGLASTIPKRGDSGGALLLKGSGPEDDVQIGLVSFGHNKPGRKELVPTVYGSIEVSIPWVTLMTEKLSRCGMQFKKEVQ